MRVVDEELANLLLLVVDDAGIAAHVRESSAAVLPVVVDRKDQLVAVAQRPAVRIAQADDAAADRLRHVDAVSEPGERVVVVVRDPAGRAVVLGVDFARIESRPLGDLHEVPGRVLQIILELAPRDEHSAQSVVEDVEPRDVLDRHVSLREHCGSRERRGLGDDGQALVLRPFEPAPDVVGHDVADKVEDGRVLVVRRRRREPLLRLGNDGVDVGDGRLVVGLQLLVPGKRRRIGDLVGVLRLGERSDLRIGPRPGNLVAAPVLIRLQGKRHLRNRLSPIGRLGEEHRITVGGAEDLRGNVHVRVPADHQIDVVDLRRHRSGHILLEKCGIPGHALGVEPRVHERHHDVGAPRLHLGHVLLRRHNGVAKLELALYNGPVPHAHTRSDEPDHSDFDSLPADGAINEGVGLERRRLRAGFDDVGPQKRRLQLSAVVFEDVEPVVEFVVAQRLSVVSDVVERFRHGVRPPLQQLRALRGHVGQRRPLNRVAVVDDQHGPLRLGFPCVLDDRGGPRHAELADLPLRIRPIAEIVPVVCVSVDVGGGHDGQIE